MARQSLLQETLRSQSDCVDSPAFHSYLHDPCLSTHSKRTSSAYAVSLSGEADRDPDIRSRVDLK